MIRLLLAILLVICASFSAKAEDTISANPGNCEKGFCTEISCEKGYCEGWEGSYELASSMPTMNGTSFAYFYFKNVSGKTAFNIKIMINFFDFFGKFIGRHQINEAGPISVHMNIRKTIPPGTSKISYDIYWSDEYLPARQVTEPVDKS